MTFEGEWIPKKDFNPFKTASPNPLIFPKIQSFTELIPFHKPLTRLTPTFVLSEKECLIPSIIAFPHSFIQETIPLIPSPTFLIIFFPKLSH